MYKIKKGDIVGRKSYGKDILFIVEKIIKHSNEPQIAILKGMTIRIEADSPVEDLVIIEKQRIDNNIRTLNNKLENRIKECTVNKKGANKKFFGRNVVTENTGLILHLDGDRKYSEKSDKYYKKVGLNAIVRNIAENKQPYVIIDLLNRYKPDVLVITGHDRNDKKWDWIQ